MPDIICHDYIAKVARVDDILHGLDGRIVALRVRGHELDTVGARRFEHLFGFRRPDSGRLLHEDVFARFRRVQCGLIMQPVRQSADDDLHIVACDGIAVIRDEVHVLMLVR